MLFCATFEPHSRPTQSLTQRSRVLGFAPGYSDQTGLVIMTDTRNTGTADHRDSAPPELDIGLDPRDWGDPEPEPRDWKKLALVIGLGGLSWIATYVGMLELIQANMGELPLTTKAIIGFSVAMLMTMIVWLLDQIFSPIPTAARLSYIGGYVFLTLISVGFGFGFYWKVLESRSESTRSAEAAIGQVQVSLHAASTRLEQLNTTLLQLTTVSAEKAVVEANTGKSCPNSRPGDGPRRKLRDSDSQQFQFASDFVSSRISTVNSKLGALDADLVKIVQRDASTIDPKTGTRNDFLRDLNRGLDLTVAGFNAFRTDPQLRQIRVSLSDRGEKTIFPNGSGGTFTCPDAQLQTALRGVVRAIDQLPELSKPTIAAVEGSEATIEAFRRLTATLTGALQFDLPPSADELRSLQQKAVQSVQPGVRAAVAEASTAPTGLSKRDYVPLAIALFVDLCLLLVSMGRPMNRFMATKRRMIEAESGPVFPILHRFNAIHNRADTRETFAIFREVIFDSGGVYHVAVPLNAPTDAPNRDALMLEAQTLANLCFALEGQGVLVKPWRFTPSLLAARKLRRQGSKFVTCYPAGSLLDTFDAERERPTFRVYAFKNGAWPEMILGAVMGAARKIEAEELGRKRHRAHLDMIAAQNAPPTPVAPAMPAVSAAETAPSAAASLTIAADALKFAARSTQKPDVTTNSTIDTERDAAAPDIAAPEIKPVVQPEIEHAYGAYAHRAQREIAENRFRASIPSLADADIDEITRARRRQRAVGQSFDIDATDAAALDTGASVGGVAADAEFSGGEIVTFPNARRAISETLETAVDVPPKAVGQPSTSDLTSAADISDHSFEDRTDVTLVRETATFSIPSSVATVSTTRGAMARLDPRPEPDHRERDTAHMIPPAIETTWSDDAIEATPLPKPVTADVGVSEVSLADSVDDDDYETFEETLRAAFEDTDNDIDIEKITQRFAPPPAE